MKVQTGCDIISVKRINNILFSKELAKKIFQPSELLKDKLHLAGVFAVKEAAIKALGLKPDSWLKIEVKKEKNGKPRLSFSKDLKLEPSESIDCSISHDGDYAVAVVVALVK